MTERISPQLAGVTREPAMLWHALRRKWATERKGYPVKDVMQAGGWLDEATLVASYQHADPETVRRVVLHPTQRLRSPPTRNRSQHEVSTAKSPAAELAAGLQAPSVGASGFEPPTSWSRSGTRGPRVATPYGNHAMFWASVS